MSTSACAPPFSRRCCASFIPPGTPQLPGLPECQRVSRALTGSRCIGQAVTLEHVPKAIAFDLSSAPQRVAVLGFQGPPGARGSSNSTQLLNFAYDLAKSEPSRTVMMPCFAFAASSSMAVMGHYGADCWLAGPVQTFPIKGVAGSFDHVRFLVRFLCLCVLCPDVSVMCGCNNCRLMYRRVCFEFEMPFAQVVSNHGNEKFICLYRVRVHGSPAHGAT